MDICMYIYHLSLTHVSLSLTHVSHIIIFDHFSLWSVGPLRELFGGIHALHNLKYFLFFYTTPNDGYLGLVIDEGRSEVR